MSDYQGNIIIKNPATPTGPAATGRAPGMWKLSDVAYWVKQGVWPNPAINPDQYFPYVSLLLSTTSLGNANNNLFVDSSGAFNPISRNGNTTQGSFTPYSTNWSNFFDGSGDYFTVPYTTANFDWWTSGVDFTIEYWFFANSLTGTSYVDGGTTISTIVGNRSATTSTNYWSFGPNAGGTVTFYYYNGSPVGVNSTSTITANTWNHIAMTKTSSGITIFVNGVAQTTTAISGTPQSSASFPITVGQGNNTSYNGYISNLRIVRGTAIYSGNFTPPTAPLTAVTNTTLLTCQSNRFRDASTNNLTLTVTGDTRVTDFGPFSSSTYAPIAYNQSDITNWSGYFDGSGDYLTSPDNAAVQFGSGDFTIEMWVYFSTTSGTQVLLGSRANTGVFAPYQFYYTGGVLYLYGSTNGSSWNIFNGLTVIPSVAAGQWYHVAVVRSGSNFSTYSNGVRQSNTTVSGSLLLSSAPVTIGADASGANPYTGYISNLRMVKGTAVYNPSQSTITVPTTNLTAISGTSLLTLQNAAFTDNSTNNFPITITGNTTVTGNSPFNTVGYWSNYFDGSGDYLQTPSNAALAMGTGDFTIEWWQNLSTAHRILGNLPGGSWAPNRWVVGRDSGNTLLFYVYNYSSSSAMLSGTFSYNTWEHIAVTRSGNSWRLFINGVLQATVTSSASLDGGSSELLNIASSGLAEYITGSISNLRIVKGSAVYTSSFTPPTSPLTAISGTSLLTCQNGRFIDNSSNNFTLTRYGDTSAQSFDPFYTATIASNGGSMYFDGTGDYLQVPRAANLLPGTNDFTLEAWVYPTTTGTTQFIMGFLEQGVSGDWSMFRYTNDTLGIYTQVNGDSFGGVIARNQWNHVALSRVSGTLYKCVNGSATTVSWTGTLNSNLGYNLTIGADNAGDENFFTGWMYGTRIVNGTGLYSSTTYTVPTTPFTPTANTSFLLNGMNAGIYDATTINDMETVGNAQVRFPTPFAPADYYAGAFDGAGDYLTVPYSTALQLPGDFTIEAWVYLNSRVTSFPCIIANYSTYAANGGFALFAGHNFNTTKYTVSFNGSFPVLTSSSSIVYGAWTHVAVVRSGSTLTLYINGVSEATATNSATVTGTGDNWWIATSGDSTASSYINGSISNLRIVKGTAVYTGNFTPSTTPLTAISGTSLLTCQNKTFIDNSTNAIAITSYGNATAGAIGPFTATGGTSMYFDGTGDYLVPNGMQGLGSGDFTVEFWMYPNSSYSGAFAGILDTSGRPGAALVYVGYTSTANQIGWYQGTSFILTASVTQSTWQHVAITRASGTIRMFVNGTLASSTTTSENYTVPFRFIGSSFDGAAYNGYLDDLRLTRGVARYTSNFTPPTQPFPIY